MAKPSSTATWDSNGTNLVAPISGHITDGFATDEIPDSASENGWRNIVGQWTDYLNTGDLELGDITADTVTTTGVITAGGAITAPAYHVTTAQSMVIPAVLSADNSNGLPVLTHLRAFGGWQATASVNPIYYPIMLPVGSVITQYAIDLTKNDTTNAMLSRLVYWDSAEHNVSAGATSSTSAGIAILGESSLSFTVTAGRQYYIKITPGGTVVPSADTFTDVTVKWTY
jgi:hypothetical protein